MNRCNSRQLIKLVRKNAQNCAVCDFSGGVGVSPGVFGHSQKGEFRSTALEIVSYYQVIGEMIDVPHL